MYRLGKKGWQAFGPDGEALTDRGFWLGDGVFETMRIDNGVIRNSQLHARSLKAACDALGLAGTDWRDVERGVAELAGSDSGVAKVIVTRGPAPRGLGPVEEPRPQVFLQLSEGSKPPRQMRLASVPLHRSPYSLAARFKTMSYADNLAARRLAADAGADMALLTTTDGHLSGGDSVNLFWVTGGRVFTPSTACGIRNGVMRQRVMQWLAAERVPVVEVEAQPDRLAGAEAMFVTNALMGAVAVSEVDGQKFAQGYPLLARLQAADL